MTDVIFVADIPADIEEQPFLPRQLCLSISEDIYVILRVGHTIGGSNLRKPTV